MAMSLKSLNRFMSVLLISYRVTECQTIKTNQCARYIQVTIATTPMLCSTLRFSLMIKDNLNTVILLWPDEIPKHDSAKEMQLHMLYLPACYLLLMMHIIASVTECILHPPIHPFYLCTFFPFKKKLSSSPSRLPFCSDL